MVAEKSTILVIDDQLINRKLVQTLLSKHNYNVILAEGGLEGLKLANSGRPDLILLDVMMPKMNGFEVCKRLKQSSDIALASIPIIFLTATDSKDDIIHGFDVGGEDYISKPFHTAELLARIKTHIQLQKALHDVKALRGIIPICSECRKLRTDDGAWQQLEEYFKEYTDAVISHGICDDCMKKHI
jgi:DNA-binding response OmpR family regulator